MRLVNRLSYFTLPTVFVLFLSFALFVPPSFSYENTLSPSGGTQQSQPLFTPAQLDQMLAPIALYPDALLEQIMMAATYPLEVVSANRWARDPINSALKGDRLASALQNQPWDPSVRSLVPFPQVLTMMDKNLTWTENLGDAFLAQQNEVMDAVQRLRWSAKNAGKLESSERQRVVVQEQVIVVEPTNPNVVYVPAYNPVVVYPRWAYPQNPPYFFPLEGVVIGTAVGFAVVGSYWGWHHYDWRSHRMYIDPVRYNRINFGRPAIREGEWRHDPYHRHGVIYRDNKTRARFGAVEGRHGRGELRGEGARAPLHNERQAPHNERKDAHKERKEMHKEENESHKERRE